MPSPHHSDSRKPVYSERLGRALRFAADAFDQRMRKGTGAPYMTHLLSVTSLVMDWGGDEDQMIAAVLHDLLEDIPTAKILMTLNQHHIHCPPEHDTRAEDVLYALRFTFGTKAIDIVEALSDSRKADAKEPWANRKRRFISTIAASDYDTKLVCAADKTHNMRSLVRDFGLVGKDVFNRFGDTSVHDHLWYYRRVVMAIVHKVVVNGEASWIDELYAAHRKLEDVLGLMEANEVYSCAYEVTT